MTSDVRSVLASGRRALAGRVDSPEVDAEVLVCHALGVGRAALYADPARSLTPPETAAFASLIERRAAGEPLQYLTGHQAFRQLDLLVGPGVLVPRHETEIVAGQALARLEGVAAPLVVDVGTGSGAIALSVAAERPDARVWGTELSPCALAWAQRNAERLGLGEGRVQFVAGDLFAGLPVSLAGQVDLVVANPPYLSADQVDAAATDVRGHEPLVALAGGGPTGAEVPLRVVAEALAWLRPGTGWLVMETWPGQAEELVSAAVSAGYVDAAALPDLNGSLRLVEARRP